MSHAKNALRALVLDADLIPCLTIVRSLTRKGIACDVASHVDKPLTSHSRHADRCFRYPDPLTQAGAFVDSVVELLQNNRYNLVVPVTERSLVPLAYSDKLDPWREQLAIADRASLNQALDKALTLQAAAACQVPAPYSHRVATVSELENLIPQLTYPAVLKPAQSIADGNDRQQLSVQYAANADQALKIGAALLTHCPLLVQQYATGVGTGIELLADRGEIVFAFQHQRLHELPLTGGGSCYRKSIPVNPVLLAASAQLIKALNWHGVAMVEFKWNAETGEYWLMEINGRFWGSLPLACAAGADFPGMLFDLLVHKQRPASDRYRPQVHCRKLSADIYWYEQVLRRSDPSPLIRYPSTGQLLRDALFALHPTRHYFDVQSWRDPLPGWVDLQNIAAQYRQRFGDLLADKWQRKRHRSAAMQKRLGKRLQQARSALFVCYGNINRSALAQALAEQKGPSAVRYESAGFHPVAGRPADPNMIDVADQAGYDLTASRSQTLDQTMLDRADIVLVMEIQQLQRLSRDYPAVADKAFLLGTLTAERFPDVEIADPYNLAPEHYRRCFNRIDAAIDKIRAICNNNAST